MKIDGKGRITLPKDLREFLGVEPGDKIMLAMTPDREGLQIVPVEKGEETNEPV